MSKHLESILASAGLTAEEIKTVNDTADDATFDAKPYIDKVRENYSKQIANDPAFFTDITIDKLPSEIKKKMENTQYGRAAKIVQDKFLKGLGMTEADFDDLPDEEKQKLESFIPKITDKYAKTKAGDKQLQADLIEARKKLEGFDGYEEKTRTKYETEYNDKFTKAILTANLISELSSIPGLKISAKDIASTAKEIVESKYAFEKVGDFSVELRQKANPQMKVLKENSSHELTLKEALTAIAEERGWVEKPTETKTGGGVIKTVIEPNKGILTMAPHLQDKISKKIAAEK